MSPTKLRKGIPFSKMNSEERNLRVKQLWDKVRDDFQKKMLLKRYQKKVENFDDFIKEVQRNIEPYNAKEIVDRKGI